MPKILVIDDMEKNLKIISAMLTHRIPHCRMITADSGVEGLKKARMEQPDTILLDVSMPEMDGFEVCEKLKSGKDTTSIPVVMISGVENSSESRVRGFETGAVAFLTKPVTAAEIVAQVKAALRIKRAEEILLMEKDIVEDMVDGRTSELKESEARYKMLMNIIPHKIFHKDKNLTYVGGNRSFAESVNLTSEELLGKTDYDLFPEHPDLVKKYRMDDERVMKSGETEAFEEEFLEGHQKLVVQTIKSPIVENGKTTGILGISLDISDRKHLETQLRQAQKMEALGTLAGGIAHDFNNILASIMGYTQLAEMNAEDSSQVKADLKEVLRASYRAKDLVKQIVTFSRGSEHEPRPIWISPVIKEALKLLRSSLPSTIEFKQKIESGIGTVRADPTQIHQVLMNLCTNAAHAMEETGGILEVGFTQEDISVKTASLHSDLHPGSYVNLRVADTGCGMPADVVERIFDPYYTTKEKDKGTGLGLSIVHGIVKNHGGAITVRSRPKEGSQFDVYLPKLEKDTEEKPEEEGPLDELPRGKEHVLLVDDEPALVTMGRRTLEKLGYKVTGMTNSLEALELFKTQPEQFDLLISDTTMPGMTGDQLAEECIGIRPDIPIILCTGHSARAPREEALQKGVRAFAMKPIMIRDLAHMVRKVLGTKD